MTQPQPITTPLRQISVEILREAEAARKRIEAQDTRCSSCIETETACLFGEGDSCPYRQTKPKATL